MDIDAELRQALNDLADLVPAAGLIEYRDELKRARKRKRNGTVRLDAEVVYGKAKDAWISPRYRPNLVPAEAEA